MEIILFASQDSFEKEWSDWCEDFGWGTLTHSTHERMIRFAYCFPQIQPPSLCGNTGPRPSHARVWVLLTSPQEAPAKLIWNSQALQVSASQSLVCLRSARAIVNISFGGPTISYPFSRSGVGPSNLHSQQVSRWCRCCWPRDLTLEGATSPNWKCISFPPPGRYKDGLHCPLLARL